MVVKRSLHNTTTSMLGNEQIKNVPKTLQKGKNYKLTELQEKVTDTVFPNSLYTFLGSYIGAN